MTLEISSTSSAAGATSPESTCGGSMHTGGTVMSPTADYRYYSMARAIDNIERRKAWCAMEDLAKYAMTQQIGALAPHWWVTSTPEEISALVAQPREPDRGFYSRCTPADRPE